MAFVDDAIASMAAAAGTTPEEILKLAQKNALTKQYDVYARFTIKESGSGKPFYDSGEMVWSGMPYPIMVVMEKALVQMLENTTDVGAAIGAGSTTPPAKP